MICPKGSFTAQSSFVLLPQGQSLISDEKLSFSQGAGFLLSKCCREGAVQSEGTDLSMVLRQLSGVPPARSKDQCRDSICPMGQERGMMRGGWSEIGRNHRKETI